MKNIYGREIVSLQETEIVLPSFLGIKPSGVSLAFIKHDNDLYYSVYLLTKIKTILDDLMQKKQNASNSKQMDEIVSQINSLFACIKYKTTTKNGRRIVLPHDCILNAKNNNNQLLIEGRDDYFALYDDLKQYDSYHKSLPDSRTLFRG